MRQTDLYVLRRLLVALGAAAGALCPLLLLATALRFVDDIVERGAAVELFAALVLLALPYLAGVALPLALLIAILTVYVRMASESELIVMRAAGVSDLRLAAPALLLGLAIMGIVAWNALVLAPSSESELRDLRSSLRDRFSILFAQPGTFRQVDRDMTLFVHDGTGGSEYSGILLQDDRDPERRITYMAERGTVSVEDGIPRLTAFNGSRHEIDRETGRLTLVYFDRNTIELNLPPVPQRARSRRERTLDELLNPSAEEVGRANVAKHRAEGHFRLASGLMPGAMAVVALACLLLGGENRQGQAFRPALAGAIAFGLLVGAYATKAAVAKLPVLAGLQYAIGVVPILVGFALLALSGRRQPASV